MSMCQIKTKTVHRYSFIYHFLWTAKVRVLYINVCIHITIVWVGEGECETETPHSLCINAAQLAQYCPLQQHRQTQISPIYFNIV